ncbi:MAG: thioesterase family protein [Lawsonibacter sp.]|jgi:fluoroacetyl-CoA thioesterase|nr:thioesterase family protein [Lawsonibacter sp.]
MSVIIGLKGRAETVVSDANTAQAACSGALPVFGTPFMCALMEEAAWKSIAPHLEPGQSTVGTRLNVSHDSATPVGMRVWAESEITQVDGKRLVLNVAAFDERGPIGQGVHERFVITDQRFLAKAAQKLEAQEG